MYPLVGTSIISDGMVQSSKDESPGFASVRDLEKFRNRSPFPLFRKPSPYYFQGLRTSINFLPHNPAVSDTQKGNAKAEDSPVSPLRPSKQLNSTSSPFSFDKRSQKLAAKASGRATGHPGTADRTLLDLERVASEDDTPRDSGSGEGAAITEGLMGSDSVSSGKIEEFVSLAKASEVAETQPTYEIVQQGEMDLSSFWCVPAFRFAFFPDSFPSLRPSLT